MSSLLNGLIFEGPDANTFDARKSSGLIADGNKTPTVAQYAKNHREEFGAFTQGPPGEKGSILFLSYYFFDPPNIDWVRTQRAIILFHEAVHQVGGKGDKLFGNSKQLSEKIIEKCFPALKGKLGGVG